jgi:alkanesulfonate monooxygenase SsuD/methylene tetrahydromethanopterin reductase-like flavin-dependent oxidoreductase (luciferase family)
MKVSVMYELQPGPAPYPKNRQEQVYEEALRQILVAEEYGFHQVWETEHHMLGDWSYSGAPEVFLTWVAAHTSTIRVGHGVVLPSKEINHPWRIAERAAALDLVSGGRLDVGVGRGIAVQELLAFGADPGLTRAYQVELLKMLPQMWSGAPFSWESDLFQLPERTLTPTPVQDPHPPLWVACGQPESFAVASKYGAGALSFGFPSPEMAALCRDMFDQGKKEREPVSTSVNENLGVALPMFCAATDEEARHKATESLSFMIKEGTRLSYQWQEYAQHGAAGVAGYELYADGQLVEKMFPGLADVNDPAQVCDWMISHGMALVGSPDTIREGMKQYADAGADHLLLMVQIGRLKHDDIVGSLKLVGDEVIAVL